jgi:hypothetical protein
MKYCVPYGGEGGIRTLGAVADTLVFETSQFNHSCTSPSGLLYSHICYFDKCLR